MDSTALFTITYGLYLLGAESQGKGNVCVINTLNQVTQDPMKVSITVLKSNLTHDMVDESKKFSVSVVSKYASLDTVAQFGFQSGRDVDKLADFPFEKDSLGTPVIEKDCIATMSCKVIDQVDLGTHTLFIADVVEARNIVKEEPMTYAFYRDLKMGKVSNEKVEVEGAQEQKEDKATYQCSICHYVYDGDVPFEELPEDYVCPLCNQPKSAFAKTEK